MILFVYLQQNEHNNKMKRLIVIYALSVAFVFGSATTAFAAEYTVKKGDTLYLIAQRFNVPFQDILRANQHYKNPNLIYPNEIITIPDKNAGAGENQNTAGFSAEAQEVLKIVNAERAKAGLKPLTLSTKLTEIANVKARDMADKNYFSHNSPTYGTPFAMLKNFGVSYRAAGENIAMGQKTPREVMTAWLNSTGHRANILNVQYEQLGVGYYKKNNTPYWVQTFIKS